MQKQVKQLLDWGNPQAAFFVWGAVLFAYLLACVPPNGDTLGIISTGKNLLASLEYREYAHPYSHRGLFPSILFASASEVTGSFRLGVAAASGVAAAVIVHGLYHIATWAMEAGAARLSTLIFLGFPFVPYAANTSSVHLLQTALFLQTLRLSRTLWKRGTAMSAIPVGICIGLGAITHPYSLFFAPVLGLFAVWRIVDRSRRQALLMAAWVFLPMVLTLLLQVLLVYRTTGRFSLSAEPFSSIAAWNPLNYKHGVGNQTDPAVFARLTGLELPSSASAWALAMLKNPAVYLSDYVLPVVKLFTQELRHPFIAFFWLPLAAIGAVTAKRQAAFRYYLGFLLVFSFVTAAANTLLWTGRYWFPVMVLSTPLVAWGIIRTQRSFVSIATNAPSCRWWPTKATLAMSSVVLVAGAVASSTMLVRSGPWSSSTLIFNIGESLRASADEPPTGSLIFTSTAKPHLWRPDLHYRLRTLDNAPLDSSAFCTTATNCYALLETHHNRGCDYINQLLKANGECSSAMLAGLTDTEKAAANVVAIWTKGAKGAVLFDLRGKRGMRQKAKN